MIHFRRAASHHRRAILTMSVLVCLSIVMVLFAAWMKTLVLEQRQLRTEHDRVQAEYVALSAMQRAAARAKSDPAYAGETWRIDEKSLGLRSAASAVIHVQPVADEPAARWIKVEASYPEQGPAKVRRSHQTKLIIEQAGEAP